jgi:integrase
MIATSRRILGERVTEYLEHRRSLGFGLKANEVVLSDLVRFAKTSGHRGPLTTEFILRWATHRIEHSSRYQAERLSIARGFAQYLAARDGKSEVPDQRLLGGRFHRGQPHIYSDEQLRQLLETAIAFPSADPLRRTGYATVFGLLASTGMRVSEPLRLGVADVDLDRGVLRILETKFHKSRLVPMHATVIEAMRRYAAQRDRDPRGRSSAWFFLGRGDRRLPYRSVLHAFRRICSMLGWRGNGDLPLPRIHDLRHNTESRIIRRARAGGAQDRRTYEGRLPWCSALSGRSDPSEKRGWSPPSNGHGHVLRDRDGRRPGSQREARRPPGRVRSLALGLWVQPGHGSPVSPGGDTLQSVARRQEPG